jgi:hypothetical protein
MITFGNGAGDFVQLDPTANAFATVAATASDTGNASGTADASSIVNVAPNIAAISNDNITFGNGDGDFVKLAGASALAEADATGSGGNVELETATLTAIDQNSQMSDNAIKFGNGNGDFVSAAANFSGNKIVFGNGDGDYVSVTDGTSTNNQIIFGNGNNDAVTLPSGAGGDTIVTGTGNSDTVQVGAHTTPDTFGFALGTGGTALSQTTATGAQAADKIAVGNTSGLVLTAAGGLGNTLVQDGATAGLNTVNDFINFLVSHGGLTKGDTYTADSGGNTFIVTDTSNGHVGGVEIAGIAFESNSITGHILTLG